MSPERFVQYAALGLRFLDQTTGDGVAEGLMVTARLLKGGSRPVRATLNGAGIFAFAALPGVPDSEPPRASSPPLGQREFIIEVWDRLGRFVPMATTLALPTAQNLKEYYLFSAPTRQVTTGIGIIRGQLWDQARDAPAAHAVVEAEEGGLKWYGVADERGCVAVTFPYPNFRKSATSPPSSQQLLINQGWTYTLRTRYQPGSQAAVPGAVVPELRTILAQAPCSAITHQGPPDTVATQFDVTIQFGQEFVLRTDARPVLLLSPSSSPP